MHARVATFEGGDPQEVRQVIDNIRERSEDGPPEGVPATGLLILKTPDGSKVLTISFFESEEDMRQGDEGLNAMDPPTPGAMGKRTSVDLCEVGLKIEALTR